jgi:hypothetical protein
MLTEKKVVQCTKCLHNFHVKVPFALKSLTSYHIELCLLCQKGPFWSKSHLFFCLCYWLIEETNAVEHYERTKFDLYKDNICLVLNLTYILMDNFFPCLFQRPMQQFTLVVCLGWLPAVWWVCCTNLVS